MKTPIRSVSFVAQETEELAEGVACLGWDSDYVALASGFRANVDAAETPGAQLARARFRTGAVARGGAPHDAYVLVLKRGRSGEMRLGGEEIHRAKIGLIRPDRGYEFHTPTGAELVLLSVPRDRVESATRALWGGEGIDETGDCSTLTCLEPCSGGALVSRWTTLLEEVLEDCGRLAGEGIGAEIDRALLEEALLAAAPPERRISSPDRRQAARRAEAYLRENWRRPLTLGDLCRVGDVSERRLRRGFQELYGRAPKAYLRSIRLDAARTMLRGSAPGQTISDVALLCGFTHLGRFSVDYRRAYGETPSQTRSS